MIRLVGFLIGAAVAFVWRLPVFEARLNGRAWLVRAAAKPVSPTIRPPSSTRPRTMAISLFGLLAIAGAIVVAVVAGHGGGNAGNAGALPAAVSEMRVSKCELGGKTLLVGIPVRATEFRFVFFGGQEWHTDWLPNDGAIKGGTHWIDTLGASGATPTGVRAEANMDDGSTVDTDLQVCD